MTIADPPSDVENGRFAWREAGEGPLVLFLHGLGGSRIAWESQLTGLATVARAVAWDLPGYGASAPLDVEQVTFTDWRDAVVDLIDALGVADAHLVGLSMGGMIAQYVAAEYPARVASLTLLATSPKFGLDGTQPDEWRRARLAPLDDGLEPADFADAVIGAIGGPGLTPQGRAEQVAAMRRISADALRRSIECLVTHDSRSILGSIRASTVCAVGAEDDETPPSYTRYLVDHIPGARLVTIPGAGHLLPAEAPDAVNALIREQIESTS